MITEIPAWSTLPASTWIAQLIGLSSLRLSLVGMTVSTLPFATTPHSICAFGLSAHADADSRHTTSNALIIYTSTLPPLSYSTDRFGVTKFRPGTVAAPDAAVVEPGVELRRRALAEQAADRRDVVEARRLVVEHDVVADRQRHQIRAAGRAEQHL